MLNLQSKNFPWKLVRGSERGPKAHPLPQRPFEQNKAKQSCGCKGQPRVALQVSSMSSV